MPEQVKVIPVPWEKVKSEYDWINSMQGEAFVTTYLVNHPEFLEENLNETGITLAGIEVAIPESFKGKRKRPRVDLVFRSGKKYFVVEAKENRRKDAEEEAKNYARAFEKHLKNNGISYTDVVPVAALMKYPKGDSQGWLVGEPIW